MKRFFLIVALTCIAHWAGAQVSAKLMRHMDISDRQIAFVYGGDIWLVPKTGGTASQLTHSPGEESWPRFSPDGKSLAFTANYNGNPDVYVMPVSGGVPKRVTWQSHADRMVDWHPDGERILFASKRESGRQSYAQFYLVDKDGGMPEKLKLPYGELASFSPDGSKLAYITKITENYPFKRYRGGLSSDILICDLEDYSVKNITNSTAIDGKPAWVGEHLFFLSDQGGHMRLNVWVYDPSGGNSKQVTFLKDFDISFLSASENELVFEAGGDLYRMDASTHDYQKVPVYVASDLSLEMPRKEKVGKQIRNMSASPGGKRIVFEARGELFDVPVKEGYTLNLTRSSGAFDMLPAWSPDGKWIAYWSDRSGEYEMYIRSTSGKGEEKQLTQRGKGFGYQPYWSPDSKKIAFIDESNTIYILDVESKALTRVDKALFNIGHGARFAYPLSWSSDAGWLAYALDGDNANSAIFLYELASKKVRQVTSGFYSDSRPVFSEDGKYLFFLSDRSFSAMYSDMDDGTWVYPNATQLAAMALTADAPDLLKAKNDELSGEKEVEDRKEGEDEKDEALKNDARKKKKKEAASDEKEAEEAALKIEFDNMESRVLVLPPSPGNIGWIAAFKGKVAYLRYPNSGSGSRSASLMYYDLDKREEKTIMSGVSRVVLSADGKQLLVSSKGKYAVIKPAEKQKIDKPIPTTEMAMDLVPREEWRQIFNDTWRRHRDFFYDPDMQGVDWEAMRVRYGALIEDARSRWDVSFIQSNLNAELSAGHTYTFGGDTEDVPRSATGFLGIDWELKDGKYLIKRIVKPAAWDTEVRSPFDRPGVDVKPGEAILSVNGMALDPALDPYAVFDALSGKTVVLRVSATGSMDDARDVVVQCLTPREELQLRYLEWIERNRKMVEELSGGKLGYIYMSNTSGRGQLELVKMFYGQLDKKGFIIDERFNGGGQLADRFLELLQRPVVYNLHWRHGRDVTQPLKTNTGPMGMLINGWAGSGGDGLPWAFRELEAGPIVGERTLGILVGPATGHRLIDGGGITVPGARLYDNDGHWFWEGEGVAPDIPVWDDPNILMEGRDPQIERVVKEVLKNLEANPPAMTPAPAKEDRTAAGQQK